MLTRRATKLACFYKEKTWCYTSISLAFVNERTLAPSQEDFQSLDIICFFSKHFRPNHKEQQQKRYTKDYCLHGQFSKICDMLT